MRVVRRFGFSFLVLLLPLALAQRPPVPVGPSGETPLEIRLAKPLIWQESYLQVSIRLINRSEYPVFLSPTPFEGIEAYSSVTDSTNTLGQGTGEAWVMVYGWTDVIYLEPESPVPRLGSEKSFSIWESFPIVGAEKGTAREVPVQGRLRICVSYSQKRPESKTSKKHAEQTTRNYVAKKQDSDSWSSGTAVLEIPIPCREGVVETDCFTPPPIFQGEHEPRLFELEPPPTIQPKPPALPAFPVNSPPPPKPESPGAW
jgi:hypothetical protein